MRWVVIVMCCSAIACEPTITDPCPGQRTCPDEVCCDVGFPYHCGTQCFQQPCGGDQVTCVNVDRTDGCYGGNWKGSFAGGGSGGTLQFDISEHAINVTMPGPGTGTIDCDSGAGSFSVSASGYRFTGTWMHTDSQGDRISGATFVGDGSATGTWEALRIE